MNNEAKIRDLVSKHPEEDNVVLMDIMNKLIELQIPLGKLEVHNYKESVTEAIRDISKVEDLIKKLKHRLRQEVRPEVIKWHNNKPKVKRNMSPNSLKNLKKNN